MRACQPLLFIDLYGALLADEMLTSGYPVLRKNVISSLGQIRTTGIYHFVLFGTPAKTGQETLAQDVLRLLTGESIAFEYNMVGMDQEIIAAHFGTGCWDLRHSLVVGDVTLHSRLATLLHCRMISFGQTHSEKIIANVEDWDALSRLLVPDQSNRISRRASKQRKTGETEIQCVVELHGTGQAIITTGLPFFDHMLFQVFKHGLFDGEIRAHGDLDVDEHHTVEDIAITLGSVIAEALHDKRGINRYGFSLLPMDDCLAEVAIDFGGRPWFVWDVKFSRETIGTFPVELFFHFFKSFSDEAKCNLHMKVNDGNAHHQAEALFKAFGRALRQAVFKHQWDSSLPSTKGVL